MKTSARYLAILSILTVTAVADTDQFGEIKNRLAESPCVQFEFLSIVESDVFDLIDTTAGVATLARDGRYRIEIGGDTYLNDGEFLFGYVPDNNQVTIEPQDGGGGLDEVSFLIRLDKIYQTFAMEHENTFRLVRYDTTSGDLPDTMTVWLDENSQRIARLEFFDINDDRNLLVLLKQELQSACAESTFVPNFPDSADRVRLF
jgi:outer membrane lipoprotein-sorting protein